MQVAVRPSGPGGKSGNTQRVNFSLSRERREGGAARREQERKEGREEKECAVPTWKVQIEKEKARKEGRKAKYKSHTFLGRSQPRSDCPRSAHSSHTHALPCPMSHLMNAVAVAVAKTVILLSQLQLKRYSSFLLLNLTL